MTRPRILDLYCGAGGAAVGYHQAGFEVVGVDIAPQPNFPFELHITDALNIDPDWARTFDAIHASPPCQAYSTLRHAPGATTYPDLVAATRDLLTRIGRPYIIENVPGAPLHNPIRLCGSSLLPPVDGHELRRHRLFETTFPVLAPPCAHRLPVLGVYGDLARRPRPSTRGTKAGVAQAQQLMQIDWMTRHEIVQAIPPAYTRHIGRYLRAHLAA